MHDLIEVCRTYRHHRPLDRDQSLEYIAAASYVWDTVLFTVGSIFFLSAVGWFTAGAWCFIIGSLLFVTGACINVLQIVQVDNLLTLQLMNLTAVSFVVGAVLFTVALVPYLWDVKKPFPEDNLVRLFGLTVTDRQRAVLCGRCVQLLAGISCGA